MNTKATVIYCGFLFTLSAISIDIMLPALDVMRAALDTTSTAAKFTITFYLIAFGAGQLFFGPLADRFGRRPAIIAGIVLYLAGAVVCVAAVNIQMLLAGRLLGGFGAATGQVVGRAIIRDLFSGVELARNMALGMMIFSIGPLLGPLFGYGLVELAGWRSVFVALCVFSLGLLLAAVFWFQETIVAPNPRAQQPKVFAANLKLFFGNRISLSYFLLGSWVAISMYFYLANAQQIFAQGFGIGGLLFVVLFASQGFGIILGQLINRRLLAQFGTVNMIAVATTLLTAVTLVIAVTVHARWLNGYGFAALMFLYSIGFLVVLSNATALAISQHGKMAGFASSVLGFGAGVIGGVCASMFTAITDGDLRQWSLVMLGITAVTLVGILQLRKNLAE